MVDETQSDVDLIKKSDDQAVVMPQIYLNGFEVGITLSDLNIIAMTNGRQHCQLLMSFNTAKTLVAHLNKAIQVLERQTNHTIATMDNVKEAIDKAKKGPKK
ncbi:MAG: hypothetical protein F4X63_09265 [Nitrospira sp. SB0662_bin_26]|nr:hypothetical protein [Nitrospira sp. SB0662_bin_26]